MKNHLKNWLTWPEKNEKTIINIYPMFDDYPESLKEALKLQAKYICDNYDNLVIFFSGGVDSQQAAWAFREIGADVEYVFMMYIHEDKYNKEEFFFAKSFANKHNIEFQVETIDTSDMLIDVIVQDFDYFECETGFGALLQQYGFKEYVQKNPKKNLVISYGNFLYKREGDVCYGMVPSPYRGTTQGFCHDEYIAFYFYTPIIFQYYEYLHRMDRELQYLKRYQPKNLAFTELGWNLRPKMNSWEQFSDDDYEDFTMINFGDDHYFYGNGLVGGTRSYLKHSLLSEKDKINFREKKKIKQSFTDYYFPLYEFKTNV
jgi:hypothetical protein